MSFSDDYRAYEEWADEAKIYGPEDYDKYLRDQEIVMAFYRIEEILNGVTGRPDEGVFEDIQAAVESVSSIRE